MIEVLFWLWVTKCMHSWQAGQPSDGQDYLDDSDE